MSANGIPPDAVEALRKVWAALGFAEAHIGAALLSFDAPWLDGHPALARVRDLQERVIAARRSCGDVTDFVRVMNDFGAQVARRRR